jgi:hypothetical protein
VRKGTRDEMKKEKGRKINWWIIKSDSGNNWIKYGFISSWLLPFASCLKKRI